MSSTIREKIKVGDFIVERGIPIPGSRQNPHWRTLIDTVKVGNSFLVTKKEAQGLIGYARRQGVIMSSKTTCEHTVKTVRIWVDEIKGKYNVK